MTTVLAAAPVLAASFLAASETPAVELSPGDVLVQGGTIGAMGLFRVDPSGVMEPELVLDRSYATFAFDPEGNFVANVDDRVVRVDLSTGGETLLSSGGPLDSAADLFITAEGIAYGVDDSASIEGVVEVDLETGAQNTVASRGHLIDPKGVAVGPDGLLYVADPGRFAFFEGKVVRIDPAKFDPANLTANQEVIASNLAGPSGVVFETSGDLLVINSTAIERFDSEGNSKGFLAMFSPLTLRDIEIDPDGNAVVVAFDLYRPNDSQVSRVTPDGMLTVLTENLIGPGEVALVPVPEASTIALLASLAALGLLARRKRA
jgi:DNA-binding beta-propeller fold protein YncE